MTPLWWLSFADPDKPEGQRFIGVAVVPCDTDTISRAADTAWKLGCNPGGEVLGMRLPDDIIERVPLAAIGCLLRGEQVSGLVAVIEGRG